MGRMIPRAPRLRVVDPVSVHVRFPKALYHEIAKQAIKDHRSVNTYIVLALQARLAPSEAPPK